MPEFCTCVWAGDGEVQCMCKRISVYIDAQECVYMCVPVRTCILIFISLLTPSIPSLSLPPPFPFTLRCYSFDHANNDRRQQSIQHIPSLYNLLITDNQSAYLPLHRDFQIRIRNTMVLSSSLRLRPPSLACL